MRIAHRRPASISLTRTPSGLAAAGALLLLVALAAGYFASRTTGGETAASAPSRATSMADAFGIGGLDGLLAPAAPADIGSPVERNEIVTYYGNPYTPSMGILGQYTPEDAADLLAARAARFSGNVLPALHVVYAVAQPQPGSDKRSLQYLDDRTVRNFIELARRRGFITILDLQIGHSDALVEVHKIEQYLREPDVFVALDPEFALPSDKKPGEVIGSIDASDVNLVQRYLAQLTAERHLPKKMLIVHQFQAEMIADSDTIEKHDDVDLVIDMDGYGPADIKEVKYQRYGAAPYAPFAGIKIFLEHDPDPLTEQQLLALQPRPALVVYQ